MECLHRGWMVLRDGGRTASAGDPGIPVFARSCTKPFQAVALLASGAADRFGCAAEEIALASASHNGSARHRRIALAMLGRAGLAENALRCGSSEPYGETELREHHRAGAPASPSIHNCSGKHAAFLLTQIHLGGDPEAYLDPDSPAQRLVRRVVGLALDLPDSSPHGWVDGCSAPTFRPSLEALATGFARLANPEQAPGEIAPHLERIRDAIAAHPEVYSGEGRLCAAILRASGGRVVPKNGAEGVYAFGVRGRAAGFAIKVEDGSSRGYELPVVATLRAHGFVDAAGLRALASFGDPEIRNAAGLVTGRQELVQPV